MLKQIFNGVIGLTSRAATLKRIGVPDFYSPCRLAPSNFFRFLEGPSASVVHGREFVIPTDTMLGHSVQVITFSTVPSEGTYTINYGMTSTSSLDFDASASDIQTALRVIAGLGYVTVAGSYTLGFTIVIIGVQTPTAFTVTPTALLTGMTAVTTTVAPGISVPWPIKRGDRIIHDIYGAMAIDEIIEMCDLGGDIMGYRVRCE